MIPWLANALAMSSLLGPVFARRTKSETKFVPGTQHPTQAGSELPVQTYVRYLTQYHTMLARPYQQCSQRHTIVL